MIPRSMDIEAALRWAYRDELPKLGTRRRLTRQGPAQVRSAWSAVTAYGELATRVDVNRFGVVPVSAAFDDAHPDAVMIGEAVDRLDGLEIGVPEDWKPLAEMDLGPESARLVQEEVDAITAAIAGGRRVFGTRASVLVRKHALMNDAPACEAEVPELRFIAHPNGQPRWFVRRINWSRSVDGRDVAHEVEVDGMNPRAKRPYGDAYRKPYLDPSPREAILARAEYEMWHAALHHLTEELAPRLNGLTLAPFTRAPRPWLAEAAPATAPDLDDLGDFVAAPLRVR